MSVRESMSHEQAVELLPWIVNHSLDEPEKEAVLEHTQTCVICRRELNDLRQIRESVCHPSNSSPIPRPDMRKINARIDALVDRQNWGLEQLSRLRSVFDSPWRTAFVAQTVVLVVLATVLLWPRPEGTEFTTLTQTENLPDGRYFRVVFSPDIQQSQLTTLLDEFDLTIVDGPSNRGVYTLVGNTSIQNSDVLVSSLQDDPKVLFAQPIVIGPDQ